MRPADPATAPTAIPPPRRSHPSAQGDDANNEPRGNGSPNTGRERDNDEKPVTAENNGDGSVNIGGVTVSSDQVYDFARFEAMVNAAYYSYLHVWGDAWTAKDDDTKLLSMMAHACDQKGQVCSTIFANEIKDATDNRCKFNAGCRDKCLTDHQYIKFLTRALFESFVSAAAGANALNAARSATIVGVGQLKTMGAGGRFACVGNSFTADTEVQMADGSTKAIADVRIGDLVLATDPEAGVTRAEEVTALITGSGSKNLVTLTIDDGRSDGPDTAEVTSTDNHPFWVPELGEWVDATDLKRERHHRLG